MIAIAVMGFFFARAGFLRGTNPPDFWRSIARFRMLRKRDSKKDPPQGFGGFNSHSSLRSRCSASCVLIKGGVNMSTATNSTSISRSRRRTRDPVKLTALIYLREALIAERYENCADFIAIAKEFGALDAEIRVLLEDPRRHPSS